MNCQSQKPEPPQHRDASASSEPHHPLSWPLLPLPAITPLNQTTQESYTCSAVTNPPAYRAPPFPLTQKARPY
jgi:hypothetical protein